MVMVLMESLAEGTNIRLIVMSNDLITIVINAMKEKYSEKGIQSDQSVVASIFRLCTIELILMLSQR